MNPSFFVSRRDVDPPSRGPHGGYGGDLWISALVKGASDKGSWGRRWSVKQELEIVVFKHVQKLIRLMNIKCNLNVIWMSSECHVKKVDDCLPWAMILEDYGRLWKHDVLKSSHVLKWSKTSSVSIWLSWSMFKPQTWDWNLQFHSLYSIHFRIF
jgi:hypothetical protein